MQGCIGVAYTSTQSILELFKGRSQLFINFVSAKIARLHSSHLYSNSVNTGTTQARSHLFINFISAKVQDCIGVAYTTTHLTQELFQQKCKDCIGVAYTATQSILELFKLEVDYSSTSFQQKCKIA